MRQQLAQLGGLGMVLALAVPALAQDVKPAAGAPKPAVHKMELYNGTVRSVSYFGNGLSDNDRAALTDLERAENTLGAETVLAGQAERLRDEYVRDEQVIEQRRRLAQSVMYVSAAGAAPLYTNPLFPAAMWPGDAERFSYRATAGLSGYPYATTFPGPVAGYGPGLGFNRVLGATHEGPIKTDIAMTLAMPDSQMQATRNYDAAVARAAASRDLGTAMALRPGERSGVVPVAFGMPAPGKRVKLTLKIGDKPQDLDGNIVGKEGNWVIVDTDNGRERIRESEIVRIVEPKSNVKPAAGQ